MNMSIYAALLAFVFFWLSKRTIGLRRRYQVAIGDGGHPELQRAMRVHANFAEYVPFALLLIFLVEQQHAPVLLVHALGLLLLVGRTVHAYGVSQIQENLRLRIFGMMSTFIVLLVSASYLGWATIVRLV